MQNKEQTKKLAEIQNNTLASYKSGDMSFVRKLRKITKAILKDFPTFLKILFRHKEKNKTYIAVKAGGGMGDILRCATLVNKLSLLYPNITFDIYLHDKQLCKFMFEDIPAIDNIIFEHLLSLFKQKYDIVYECLQITEPSFNKLDNPIVKTLKAVSDTQKYIFDLYSKYKDNAWGIITSKYSSKGHNFMDVLGLTAGVERLSINDINLKIKETNPIAGKKYITISTGWNPRDGIKNSIPTKIWPLAHWNKFVSLFKRINPDIEVIQLGRKNTPIVSNANNTLLGKTSLEKSAAIIKDSILHIDCDGGLMHMARVLNVKSIVLFGPSNGQYVGYKKNINILSPFCGNCWHTVPGWNKKCVLGYSTAKCMESIPPQIVLQEALSYIRNNQ